MAQRQMAEQRGDDRQPGSALGVGIIGVSPVRGWATTAHIPALRACGFVGIVPSQARAGADLAALGPDRRSLDRVDRGCPRGTGAAFRSAPLWTSIYSP
jgi:hypothetical protein